MYYQYTVGIDCIYCSLPSLPSLPRCNLIGSLLSFLEIKFCTQFCKKISNSNTKSLRLSPFHNWRPLLGEIKKPWSSIADGNW